MKKLLWLHGCLMTMLCVQASFIDAADEYRPEDCPPVFDAMDKRIRGNASCSRWSDRDLVMALISDLIVRCEVDGNSALDLNRYHSRSDNKNIVMNCNDVAVAIHTVLLTNQLSGPSRDRLNNTWRKVTKKSLKN